MTEPKAARFAEFIRRMRDAPDATSHDEAFELVAETLNAVESELTDIPYDPSTWLTDGRMYPPQGDSRRSVDGRPDLVRYRSKQHNTWIRANGAVSIVGVDGKVFLDKPGADGETIMLAGLTT